MHGHTPFAPEVTDVQQPKLASPALTITDSIVARPLETDQRHKAPLKRAGGRRPTPKHHHLPYQLVDCAVIAMFTAILLSTMVRHLPMLEDFFLYLHLMGQRALSVVAAFV